MIASVIVSILIVLVVYLYWWQPESFDIMPGYTIPCNELETNLRESQQKLQNLLDYQKTARFTPEGSRRLQQEIQGLYTHIQTVQQQITQQCSGSGGYTPQTVNMQRMQHIKSLADQLIRHIETNPSGSLDPINTSEWYSGKRMKDVLQAIKTAFPEKSVYPMEYTVFQMARIRLQNAIYVLWKWSDSDTDRVRIVTQVVGLPENFGTAIIPKSLYNMTSDEAVMQLKLMNPGYTIEEVEHDGVITRDYNPKRIRVHADENGGVSEITQG
jgi:hypothetical protein